MSRKRKIWVAVGIGSLCGLLYLAMNGGIGIVLGIVVVAAYCFVAYYSRVEMEDRQEAKRLSRNDAVKLASEHMEDRRQR